jgi:hypothetical protein
MTSADSCLGSVSPEVVILARFSLVKMTWMPSQTRLASFEQTLYAIVGSKNETGKSADSAMSVTKRWRSHGATIRTPRRVVKNTQALKGLRRVGVVIERRFWGQCRCGWPRSKWATDFTMALGKFYRDWVTERGG